MTGMAALPRLYTGWVEALLEHPLPSEPRAACRACVMLAPPGDEAADGQVFFDPSAKCCTFMPSLPNFTVGRVLQDDDPARAEGRSTVLERLRAQVSVTPLGIAWTPRYALLYRSSPAAFGRNPSMRCPHFTGADGGTCRIWAHRAAACATFFCRFARGAVGKQFWSRVYRLLRLVEEGLADWCVVELQVAADAAEYATGIWRAAQNPRQEWSEAGLDDRVDSEKYVAAWGNWQGREIEFYTSCADRVASLGWNDVRAICGSEVRRLSRLVRDAHRKLLSDAIPQRLRLGSWQVVDLTGHGATVVTYSPLDPLSVSFTLLRILRRFDGRPTGVVLRELDQEEGVRLKPSLLRRLVDHGLLVEQHAPADGPRRS